MKRWLSIQCFGLGVLSVLLASIASTAQAQVNDQIYLLSNPGESIKGLIDAVSASDVTVRVNGVPRKLPANDVARIQFADSPTELLQAAAMFRKGQLKDARTELGNVNLAEVNNKWIQQDVAYMLAFIETRSALAGNGNKNSAGTLLVTFLKNHADSYHYFEAVELFGDLAFAVGSFEMAAEQYTILTKSPWPGLQVRGTLRLANSTVGKATMQSHWGCLKKLQALVRPHRTCNGPSQRPRRARHVVWARPGRPQKESL